MYMRKAIYQKILPHISIKERQEDCVIWQFTPGNLNDGKNFWDDDYLDPVEFATSNINSWLAAERVYADFLHIESNEGGASVNNNNSREYTDPRWPLPFTETAAV